ncbi:transposase [Alistipes onderdonkii]|uniref:transposase n=1 Tax=Alistipes onderdonkii TaxID=328813 RepID=UPI0036F252DE
MEQRTVKQRIWNEEIQWYEEKEVQTGKYKFTKEDKASIVSEYLTSGRTAQELVDKYHLSSRQVLFGWMEKYLNERELVSLPASEEDMAKQNPKDRLKELQAESELLRKALKLEKLRSEAYNTMIDVAEKTFNIPV